MALLLPLTLLAFQLTTPTYTREGNPADVVTKPSPGYLLMGGGKDVEEAFAWMIQKANGGDFLILRASGTPAYNPFVMKLGKVNSVATLILKEPAQSSDPEVIRKVEQAEAIFFAGGDQWNYVRLWRGTPLGKAIQQRIRKGVPVGGTSAGLAILGEHYFSAEFDTITSPQALADPFDKRNAIATGFLHIPILKRIITDSHFTPRSRIGRLATWLARLPKVRGIGIDERTALLVEPSGQSRVVGANLVWFLEAKQKPASLKPFTFRGIAVQTVAPGQSFHLKSWTGPTTTKSTLNITNGTIEPK